MKADLGVKIIIVLLAIMVVSLASALIIMKNSDDGDGKDTTATVTTKPQDTTESDTASSDTTEPDTSSPDTSESDTSESDTSVSTDPDQSTSPEDTTTQPETTTPEQTTTQPETTDPEETTGPDVSSVPEGFEKTKSFSSVTGTALNVIADVKAYEKNGKLYLKVDLYLEHYSISINSKSGKLSVGEKEIEFKTKPVSQSENKKTSTLLYSYETEIDYGETVSVVAEIDFVSVNYGGKKIGVVSLDGILVAE